MAIHLYNGSAPSLDLELDKDQYPHIAYDEGADLEYSWWGGSSWHTDVITSIGWIGVRITLKLDSYDRPHIAFKRDMQSKALYCYKDVTWHMSLLCDSSDGVFTCDLGLEIDKYNVIHAVYSCDSFITGFFKHAWRGLVSVEESMSKRDGLNLMVSTFPLDGCLTLRYRVEFDGEIEISICDITGSRCALIKREQATPGSYQERIEIKSLASGVYFLVLRQNNEQVLKKFLVIK